MRIDTPVSDDRRPSFLDSSPRDHGLGGPEVDALGERIAETASLIDSALHGFLTDLRAFDAAEGWGRQGAQTCAHWLAWRVGLELGAAREKVRVARALGGLPVLDEALRRGEVAYAKVRAITRVATRENEQALLEIARSTTTAQLERVCRQCRPMQRRPPEEGEPGKRWIRLRELDDGRVRFEVILTAEEAAQVTLACQQAAAPESDPVDGLCALAERALRGFPEGDAGDASSASSDRAPVELVVHVEAGRLEGQLESGHGLSQETCRRLLCDAGVVPMLENQQGEVLDVGRRTRTIPAALRRALRSRDGGCRFPGCRHRLVDAHHIRHWVDGGETSLRNTLLLCRIHHRLLHEAGFTVEHVAHPGSTEAGAFVFRDREGGVVPPAGLRPRLLDGGVETLRRRARRSGLRIDASTAEPWWDGSPLDADAAHDLLCSLPPL